MRVRITAGIGYSRPDGTHYRAGDVVDLDDKLAVKLLAHRLAIPATQHTQKNIETTEVAPPENAARTAKPRPRRAK